MSDIFEPDKRFLERLEWQLSSEYRRTNRLKPSSGKIAIPRKMAAVTLAVGVLLTGVAVIKAAEYFRDSWRKKIEIARVETEVKLNKAHLESAKEISSRAEARFSDGLIREEEYRMIKAAAESAELDLKRSLLDLDETKASGVVPRDELYAPKVGGRDFVSERLQIESKRIELDLELDKTRLARIKQLVENNLIRGEQLAIVQKEISARKVMIDKIRKQLELRKRFITGKITAIQVEIKGRITLAEENLQLAKSRIDTLKVQMKRMKALEIQGEVSPMEVKQLEYALTAAQAELELATVEIGILKKIK